MRPDPDGCKWARARTVACWSRWPEAALHFAMMVDLFCGRGPPAVGFAPPPRYRVTAFSFGRRIRTRQGKESAEWQNALVAARPARLRRCARHPPTTQRGRPAALAALGRGAPAPAASLTSPTSSSAISSSATNPADLLNGPTQLTNSADQLSWSSVRAVPRRRDLCARRRTKLFETNCLIF
jgi:hypothetical protein